MNIMEAAKLAKEGKTLYSKSSGFYMRENHEYAGVIEWATRKDYAGGFDWGRIESFLATDWEVVK